MFPSLVPFSEFNMIYCVFLLNGITIKHFPWYLYFFVFCLFVVVVFYLGA